MGERREQVRLVLDGRLAGRLVAIREAVKACSLRRALDEATWEPHDWREWS